MEKIMNNLKQKIDFLLKTLITFVSSYEGESLKAYYYQYNGILNRLGLLRRSFELFFPALEKLPENDFECETVNVMLNSIYLHIRGILDNTAWLIYYELNLQNLKIPRDIDFTGNKYLRAIQVNANLNKTIKEYAEWMKELKEKRDPIAHRLPLYIPAKFIDNEEEVNKALSLKEKADQKRNNNDESWIQDEFSAMSVGKFKPIIINLDAERKQGKIYLILPEIEKDIENFSKFISKIFSEMKLIASKKSN